MSVLGILGNRERGGVFKKFMLLENLKKTNFKNIVSNKAAALVIFSLMLCLDVDKK